MARLRATTILAVRTPAGAAIGGDGQVTLGQVVMKNDAKKIRRLYDGKVLAGFAGAAADAFACWSGSRPSSATTRAPSPGPPPNWPRSGGPTGCCGGWRRC